MAAAMMMPMMTPTTDPSKAETPIQAMLVKGCSTQAPTPDVFTTGRGMRGRRKGGRVN